MAYRYGQKLKTSSNKAKKFIAGIAASIAILAGAAVPALADSSGDGSGYCTQNGCGQSMSQTQCAGHGAFGAFGKDNSLAGGANGYQTGINNGTLCGNRQGNL